MTIVWMCIICRSHPETWRVLSYYAKRGILYWSGQLKWNFISWSPFPVELQVKFGHKTDLGEIFGDGSEVTPTMPQSSLAREAEVLVDSSLFLKFPAPCPALHPSCWPCWLNMITDWGCQLQQVKIQGHWADFRFQVSGFFFFFLSISMSHAIFGIYLYQKNYCLLIWSSNLNWHPTVDLVTYHRLSQHFIENSQRL